MKYRVFPFFSFLLMTVFSQALAVPTTPKEFQEYKEAITKTRTMVANIEARKQIEALGLNILNITWEDTGRYKNSAVGPNISDMSIQVALEDPKTKALDVSLMPVIRYPNFSDKTADLDPRDFTLLVGNEKGETLRRISLYDFLENPRAYLTDPDSWKGKERSLLADRDSKVLVSAQACFLPVPKKGLAIFNPVLFNYQSVKEDPAVLTVLVTRQGTSVTIIDNSRDAFASGSVWGQRLFHNEKGQRASLTGQRLSDFKVEQIKGNLKLPSKEEEAGLNMVLLIQIPLKQKRPMRFGGAPSGGGLLDFAVLPGVSKLKKESDVELAVIGHGDLEGPFTEMDHLSIERDPDFPVRVTVQFYKATSTGVLSEKDITQVKEEIDRVYAKSDFVGSLVTAGNMGRITEYKGAKVQPKDWWEKFWRRYEKNMGQSRQVALTTLIHLIGKNYQNIPVTDLYLRNLLRKSNGK